MNVLVASNNAILRDSLVSILNAGPSIDARGRTFDQIGDPDDGAAVVLCAVSSADEVSAFVPRLGSAYPEAGVLCLLSAQDDAAAISALRFGVRGVIDQSVGRLELLENVQDVAGGNFVMSTQVAKRLALLHRAEEATPQQAPIEALTQREAEVVRLLAEGCTNKVIASRLFVSEHTVRAHLRVAMQKLGVTNRVQAAAMVWQGLIFQGNGKEGGHEDGDTGSRGRVRSVRSARVYAEARRA